MGGFAGSTIMMAARYGVARGVFSNEAGLGSAPIAHAAATTDSAVKQGLWGIFEVFMDTIVVCSITALSIIVTGVWQTGETGAALQPRQLCTCGASRTRRYYSRSWRPAVCVSPPSLAGSITGSAAPSIFLAAKQ
ncbi:MAG: alanine:cation symporter family protein [Clostridia bacterium]